MKTLNLKHGPMIIWVECQDKGWRRVARYEVTLSNGVKRTLHNYSNRHYKTERGALKEAEKYAGQQKQISN